MGFCSFLKWNSWSAQKFTEVNEKKPLDSRDLGILQFNFQLFLSPNSLHSLPHLVSPFSQSFLHSLHITMIPYNLQTHAPYPLSAHSPISRQVARYISSLLWDYKQSLVLIGLHSPSLIPTHHIYRV